MSDTNNTTDAGAVSSGETTAETTDATVTGLDANEVAVADYITDLRHEVARLRATVPSAPSAGEPDPTWPTLFCETCQAYRDVTDDDPLSDACRDLCCVHCGLVIATYELKPALSRHPAVAAPGSEIGSGHLANYLREEIGSA